MSSSSLSHQYRPTPYGVALATLICLYCQHQNSQQQQQEKRSTTNDDSFRYNDNNNININSNNYNSNNDDIFDVSNSNSVIQQDQLNIRIEIFLQQQLSSTSSIPQQSNKSTNSNSYHHFLHGPSIIELLQQLYHSLSSIVSVQQQQHSIENRTTTTATTTAKQIVTQFYVWLQMMVQSIDTMIDFFEMTIKASIYIARDNTADQQQKQNDTTSGSSLIDRTSMNGVYIRSILLGYNTLLFDDIVQLYENMKSEIMNINIVTVTNSQNINNNHSNAVDDFHSQTRTSNNQWMASSDQLDRTIRDYCYNYNYNDSTNRSWNNNKPTSTSPTTTIIDLQQQYPQVSSIRFMNIISSMVPSNHTHTSRDRVTIQHALYEYIDSVFIQSHSSNKGSSNSNRAPTVTNTDILQYASILQAYIHYNFNEVNHMVYDIDEAIRVIQQSSSSSNAGTTTPNSTSQLSNTAILFAMAWYAIAQQYTGKRNSSNKQTMETLLHRCMNRCKVICCQANYNSNSKYNNSSNIMLGIHLLHASITYSWMSYHNAISLYDPKMYNNNHSTMASSNYNNIINNSKQNSTQNSKTALFDRPMHTLYFDHPISTIKNVLCKQKLVGASIYAMKYEPTLSIGTAKEILYYNHTEVNNTQNRRCPSNQQDIIYAIRNIAMSGSMKGSAKLSDQVIESLQQQNLASKQDINNTSNCIYGMAVRNYLCLCDMYQISIYGDNPVCLFDIYIVLHEWAIRRSEYDIANTIMSLLDGYNIDPNNLITSSNDMYHSILVQKVLSYSQQGQHNMAKQLLQHIIKSNRESGHHRTLAWALLQLARICIELEESQQQQFVNAVQPILECLQLCKLHKFDELYNEGLLILSHIHLYMGQCHRTSLILQMILPTLHRSSHLSIQADAYFLLAKCRMKQAKICLPSQKQRQHNLLQASVNELHRSRTLYERCQNYKQLQVIHYLLANVYHQLFLLCSEIEMPLETKRHSKPNGRNVDYVQLRDLESTNYLLYSKQLASSSVSNKNVMTASQFMSLLRTKHGIIALANRPNLKSQSI